MIAESISRVRRRLGLAAVPLALLAGCNGAESEVAAPAETGTPFQIEALARFDEPWAMAFLPDGRALVTEMRGALKLWQEGGPILDVAGVPAVDYGGQGGLGDVVLHPDFANNGLVYLSWAEAGAGEARGAAVGRARLVTEEPDARLEGLEVIWRQEPKVTGRGHYGHRLAFSPDGRYLFITSGDRQKLDPAQDRTNTLGTVVRIAPDGTVPADNPFAAEARTEAERQIWTYGHRNPLGIAFAPDGRLWAQEMGPRHGDELNVIVAGQNYGWPVVSEGDHYDGTPIPEHATRPEFAAPKVAWVPAISPAGLIVYTGSLFPDWQGSAFLGGLSGQALVRVAIEGEQAREAERWDMGGRIREVAQGPEGALYLLEDQRRGDAEGRLLRLTPAQ